MGRYVPHVLHGYSKCEVFILKQKKEVERLLFLLVEYREAVIVKRRKA